MSNSLIFYQQVDPQGDISQLDEKSKKAYEGFFKPIALSAFKDYLKRCRLCFTNPKDKNILPGWTQEFMINHIFYPLIQESINGTVKEVKGNINETLRIIFNEEKSSKNDGEQNHESILLAKQKILSILSSVISKLFQDYESKDKEDIQKSFEAEDVFTKTLNNVIDLFDSVSFKSEELKEMHTLIQNKWIPYQQNLLERLINRVINEKYFLTKHVDMIGDILRNISSTINRLNDLISNEFVEKVSGLLNVLLQNCLRLKKDIVSHASILYVYIKITKKKETLESVIHEILSIQDTNEEKSLEKLGKIRALFVYDGKRVPFHKYNLIQYVNGFFNNSNPEVRLYTLTVILLILESVQQSEYKIEFMKNEKLQFEIYDNVQRSLEYPAKKISYWIESILSTLISCSENPSKLAEKYATEALELNLSSSKRKYYLLTILLPFVAPDFYLIKDPHIIQELMISCGDYYILPAPNLLFRLLDTLYQKKCNQDLEQWRKYWEGDYFTCLKSQPLPVIKGIISAVNPILAKINKNAVVYMLSTILDSSNSKMDDKNSLWIFVSFLKVARERSLIADGPDGSFILQGTQITINRERLEKLILNKDRNVIINILEFISINPKPSEAPSELEFELLLLFLKYGTRTSYPEFRKDFLGSFKRFIERLRLVYERDIILIEEGKQPKKKNFKSFVNFIQKCVDTILSSMYPQICFEIANPMLEILQLILQNFPAHKPYEYKKGLIIQNTKFLQTHIVNPPLFSQQNVECLLVHSNSLWESIREISIHILSFFPPQTVSVEYVKNLYNQALNLSKNPQIKNYEVGAYILQLLFSNYLEMLGKTEIEFLTDIIQTMKKRFEDFTQSFLVEWQTFSDSLIHGLITALAFIIQKMNRDQIKNENEMKVVLKEMFEVICEVLAFSTKISSENVATVVLDSNSKKVAIDQELEKQISNIDCRGHFIIDEDAKQKNKFLQNMEKILQGNTLVEALEDNGAGEEGFGSENLLVVTFYLISREAGFLFQSISSLVITSQRDNLDIFDKQGLESIVNQYFHTLVNIKHIGSIDRIAIGLNTMCKAMNEVKNPILPHLSHTLLEKLLDHIEMNTFRNTLRRSAGLPYAITCLLKAESAGKRTKSLPLAIKRLLDLIENSPHKQVKIHCLNILKRIFEDSNIKLDADKFIGQGFMTAIKGFAIEDWSIRNSSLMLFSALSLRTVGGAKNPNSQTIKSKLNLVEFFTRAPELLDFFIEEISNFVHTDKYANTQYPPLYPIALLFTRLLPYDLKNQVKKAPSANDEDDSAQDVKQDENAEFNEQQPTGSQYIALTEVQKILPLLIECAKNKNYMGRVMVARSILPFMVFEKIPEESINLLNRIESYDMARKSHNFCHGILLQILNILKNYYDMKRETGIHQDEVQSALLVQNEKFLAQKLHEKSYLLTKIKCPPVQYAYLDLVRSFISNLKKESLTYTLDLLREIDNYSKSYIESQLKASTLRIQDDMGHSVLRKKLLRYTLRNRIIYEQNKSVDLHIDYLLQVLQSYKENPIYFKEEDNEFLKVILKEFYIGLKKEESVCLNQSKEKIQLLIESLIDVLKNQHSHEYFFSQCITYIMKILFKLGLSDVIDTKHFSSFWDIIKILEKKFNSNGLLVKQLVKFTGLLINNGSIDVKYFEYLCLTYSSASQMDYLRIAVIISFNICMEKLVVTLQSSKNVEDFKVFLNFCFVFLRLLQDEVPEVRQKMSNFLCKKLFSNSHSKNSEDIFLFEVTIQRFFEFLGNQELDAQCAKQLNLFFLKHIFEMEFFQIKKTNHIEQRIFAYDKSNKFIDDMRVKKYAYHHLVKLLKKQNSQSPNFTQEDLDNFISQNKYNFLNLNEERKNKYNSDFSYRDEVSKIIEIKNQPNQLLNQQFEFENNLNEFLYSNLKEVINGKQESPVQGQIEPFIRYFYQL
ncbi:hypothetical protein ABPG74_003369 [Tetrahymena malaccensis]